MNHKKRIEDIETLDTFNNGEIEKCPHSHGHSTFKSVEYSTILHYTNAELYYLDDETEETLKIADLIEDTPKGRIFCIQ
jgi:hypothetical protein